MPLKRVSFFLFPATELSLGNSGGRLHMFATSFHPSRTTTDPCFSSSIRSSFPSLGPASAQLSSAHLISPHTASNISFSNLTTSSHIHHVLSRTPCLPRLRRLRRHQRGHQLRPSRPRRCHQVRQVRLLLHPDEREGRDGELVPRPERQGRRRQGRGACGRES
ncbi:oleate-induced peroxisomal protein [Histoplasma capsulatum var. duboisii H88]|uniref:Oleate-induced peroxisomal protein n=1 Tax=Ajellomyces capsulatus (strain H88) TaxID=544711 RepID=A0A8A1LF04_AJEC8|nr:oleate-induced peroxisomal protein [Histoplasma capsulatum var. duboisii H88]